jgi:diketogulonate reductase-like aldo/keto reductase
MSEKGLVQKAVEHAISIGYRHIDAAWAYGNEGEVGDGIITKINDGTVKREDLFITTKLWNVHHKPADVARAVEMSLASLKCGHIGKFE